MHSFHTYMFMLRFQSVPPLREKITIGTFEACSVNPFLEVFRACLTGRDPELYEGLLFTSALERLWFPKGSWKVLLVKRSLDTP